MRKMRILGVGMRGMGWECRCEESVWECRESRAKYKKCVESGSDAGNQSVNLSMVVEITWSSNGK